MRPRVLLSIGGALAVLAAVVAVGALMRSSDAKSAARSTVNSKPVAAVESTTTSTTAPPPTTTTLPPVEADPANQVMPDLGGGSLGVGNNSPVVQVYKQRLADLRFDVGDINTAFDQQLQYAVQGFQKLEGIPITSRIDTATSQALGTFKWPTPLVTTNAEPSRLEVNVTKQYAVLWDNYNVKLITTVSTGAGENYCYIPLTGGSRVCEFADTPSGRYQFNYRYTGWQKSDLGQLFNPVYFNGGIAVHGYPSVPTVPASHGCVRIPMHTAGFFPSLVVTNEPVYVFGGTNGRRPVTRTPLPPAATAAPTTAPPASTAPPATTVPPATTAAPAPAPTATPTPAVPATAAPATAAPAV